MEVGKQEQATGDGDGRKGWMRHAQSGRERGR